MAWGRGGAGNYEAQEEQSKKVAENIASQHRRASRTGSIVPIRTTTSPPPPFAHSGRGGAGNTYSPAELAQTGTFQSTVNASSSASDGAVGEYVVPAGTPSSNTAATYTTATATVEPPARELSDLDTQTKWYNTATPHHASNGSSTHPPPPPPANQHSPATTTTTTTSSSEVPLARTGRGGAGNFVGSSSSPCPKSSANANANNNNTAAATPTQAAKLQRSVLADVERGLARPNRAWLGPGPGPGSPPPATATAPRQDADRDKSTAAIEAAGVGVKTSPPRKVAARKGSWVGAAVTGHGLGLGRGDAAPPA